MAASKLIVGLGNPGKDYQNTYHNIGCMFLDYLFDSAKFKVYKNFEYLKIGNVVVVKPLTFMNESGAAVASAVRYFKAKTNELLIIHDDSDIELGKYKISAGRGSAGHKGVKSIIKAVGTKDFARLRIGVRREANPPSLNLPAGKAGLRRARASDFVLKKISKIDRLLLNSAFERIAREFKIFQSVT